MQFLPCEGTVRRHIVGGLAALWLLSSCGAWHQGSAGVDDYARYRSFRTAPTLESKLAHCWSYLQEDGGGFRRELHTWLQQHEPRYFRESWNSRPKLRRYLSVLAEGPHSAQVARRLEELRLRAQEVVIADAEFFAHAQRLEDRLAAAERGRSDFTRELSLWVAQLAGHKRWGSRTSELPHELIYHFRLSKPYGRCRGDVCEKNLTLEYAIPHDSKLVPREAIYDVKLYLEGGGVVAAQLRGPGLFDRVGEATQLRASSMNDSLARAESIGFAVQLVAASLQSVMPAATCKRDAIGEVVLVRECDGQRVEMVVGLDASDDDRIDFFPVNSVEAQ